MSVVRLGGNQRAILFELHGGPRSTVDLSNILRISRQAARDSCSSLWKRKFIERSRRNGVDVWLLTLAGARILTPPEQGDST